MKNIVYEVGSENHEALGFPVERLLGNQIWVRFDRTTTTPQMLTVFREACQVASSYLPSALRENTGASHCTLLIEADFPTFALRRDFLVELNQGGNPFHLPENHYLVLRSTGRGNVISLTIQAPFDPTLVRKLRGKPGEDDAGLVLADAPA